MKPSDQLELDFGPPEPCGCHTIVGDKHGRYSCLKCGTEFVFADDTYMELVKKEAGDAS